MHCDLVLEVLKSVIVVRFDDPKTEVPVELHLRLGKMVERGVLRQELVHGERVVAWIINKTSGLTKTACKSSTLLVYLKALYLDV